MYRKYIVFSSLFVFISIRLFAQELIPFTNELKKMGYKNSKGAVVIAAQYDYAEAFYEGLAKIKALNKYGFINPAGKLIIAPQYDDAERFCNGLAVVNKGGPFSGKWGYINKEGKEIVPLTYSFTTSFSEGLGCVMKDRKYGYVDTTGKVVIPVSYLEANAFSEGVAVVFKGTEQLAPGIVQRMIKTGKYGYINKKGETVLPFNYTKAGDFKNGIAQVAINETAFFTNKQGEVTDKNGNKISSANSIKESLPAVKITSFRKDGKEGLMAKGIEIVPPVYEYTDGGDYGIGLVKKGYMSYFLVDYTGRKITDLDGITSAGSFKNGEGYATKAGKWGIIDTAGKWIVPPVYNHVSNFADGFAIAQDSANDYRIINRDNETIACCFYAIKGFKKGWWTVKRGYTDVNYVNKKGEVLFEMEVQEELLENPYNPNFINGVCSIKLGFEGDKPKEYRIDTLGNILSPAKGASYTRKDYIVLQPKTNKDGTVNDLRLARYKKLYGFINLKDEWILEGPAYVKAAAYKDGRATFTDKKGYSNIIDGTGKKYLPDDFKGGIGEFNNGIAEVSVVRPRSYDPGGNYLKADGSFLFPDKFFKSSKYLGEGMYYADLGSNSWLFDYTGKTIPLAVKFDSISGFNYGRARIAGMYKLQYKSQYAPKGFGYLNKKGECNGCFIYQKATDFIDGYAAVYEYDGKKEEMVDTNFHSIYSAGDDYKVSYSNLPGSKFIEIKKGWKYYPEEFDSIFTFNKSNRQIKFQSLRNNPNYVKKPESPDLSERLTLTETKELIILSRREITTANLDTKPFTVLPLPITLKITKYDILFVEANGNRRKYTIKASGIIDGTKTYVTYDDYVIRWSETNANGIVIRVHAKNDTVATDYSTKR